jgi:hypothetical protein
MSSSGNLLSGKETSQRERKGSVYFRERRISESNKTERSTGKSIVLWIQILPYYGYQLDSSDSTNHHTNAQVSTLKIHSAMNLANKNNGFTEIIPNLTSRLASVTSSVTSGAAKNSNKKRNRVDTSRIINSNAIPKLSMSGALEFTAECFIALLSSIHRNGMLCSVNRHINVLNRWYQQQSIHSFNLFVLFSFI